MPPDRLRCRKSRPESMPELLVGLIWLRLFDSPPLNPTGHDSRRTMCRHRYYQRNTFQRKKNPPLIDFRIPQSDSDFPPQKSEIGGSVCPLRKYDLTQGKVRLTRPGVRNGGIKLRIFHHSQPVGGLLKNCFRGFSRNTRNERRRAFQSPFIEPVSTRSSVCRSSDLSGALARI